MTIPRFSALAPAGKRREVFGQWIQGLGRKIARRLPTPPPDPERVRYYFLARSVTSGFGDFLDTATPWYVEWLARSVIISGRLRQSGPLNILDTGCGQGGLLKWILERRGSHPTRYRGLDLNDGAIARCRERFPAGIATFDVHDIHRPESTDIGSFDIVAFINVFPYLADLRPVLSRIRDSRVHANSIVVVMDPIPSSYWDADYGTFRIILRSPAEIGAEMERARFSLIERGTLYGCSLFGRPMLPLSGCSIFAPSGE